MSIARRAWPVWLCGAVLIHACASRSTDESIGSASPHGADVDGGGVSGASAAAGSSGASGTTTNAGTSDAAGTTTNAGSAGASGANAGASGASGATTNAGSGGASGADTNAGASGASGSAGHGFGQGGTSGAAGAAGSSHAGTAGAGGTGGQAGTGGVAGAGGTGPFCPFGGGAEMGQGGMDPFGVGGGGAGGAPTCNINTCPTWGLCVTACCLPNGLCGGWAPAGMGQTTCQLTHVCGTNVCYEDPANPAPWPGCCATANECPSEVVNGMPITGYVCEERNISYGGSPGSAPSAHAEGRL